MALRSSMAALITRVRLLINDPAGANQQFADTDIQDVLDESRIAVYNHLLNPIPTFSGSSLLYLTYESEPGLRQWEDDFVLKQYLITVVTPSASEPIAGKFTFAQTTLPPVFITGKSFDIYRAGADLLERLASRWQGANGYDFSSDGQSFRRSQAAQGLRTQAQTLRMKQRASRINVMRSDLQSPGPAVAGALGPQEIDYMGSG